MDSTIGGTLIQFRDSVYNPDFYKKLGKKTFREVWDYMIRMSLIFGFIELLFLIVTSVQWTFANHPSQGFLVVFAIANFVADLIVIAYVFIVWCVFGFAFSLIIFIVQSLFKVGDPELAFYQGVFASGISMIFVLFAKELQPSPWVLFGLPVLILLLNVALPVAGRK